MKLLTVYFDAFRSLLGKKIELKDNCIGLVGINESGKSNILYAINVLRGGYKLSEKDVPKMGESNINPTLRFEFELSKDDQSQILEKVMDWSEGNSLIGRNIEHSDFKLIYKIEYDVKSKQEKYLCKLIDFKLNKGYLVLKNEFLSANFKVISKGKFSAINKALIISNEILDENTKYFESVNDIEKFEIEIKNLNQEIIQSEKIVDPASKNKLTPEEISQKKAVIDKITNKKNELLDKCKEFNILDSIKNTEAEIKKVDGQIAAQLKAQSDCKSTIIQLENINNPQQPQTAQLAQKKNELATINSQLNTFKNNKAALEVIVNNLKMPFEKRYTPDPNEIFGYISSSILNKVMELLPQVVFWENKDIYILNSETLFKDIHAKSSLEEISRPLINLFRIGIGIKSLAELKIKINEISQNPNFRSQLNKTMDRKVNDYLKNVWPEYDQSLNISLENDRIRVEIYDDKCRNASFYNMEDRSQGAKTFLSFLFTIGAEAKHGIINNSILLLDEPESHLHPSGVRYLLSELKKIADKGNQVIYATHSPYMIDREHYERHFITSKDKEKTKVEPSCIDRVGIFTQEEVLYSTLDKDMLDGHRSLNDINFVFEGMGDVLLFEHYYSVILDKKPYKIDNVSFYHGGGCKRITDFLIKKPIQLGTKWFFILDNDGPADDLKKFIGNKYKNYVDKDIYVFQYDIDKKETEIVLEDMLNHKIILDCYKRVFEKFVIDYDQKKIEAEIKSNSFKTYHEKIISTELFQDNWDQAKGDFKDILNTVIREKLAQAKNEEGFKKEFPEYLTWVKSVFDSFGDKKAEKKEK